MNDLVGDLVGSRVVGDFVGSNVSGISMTAFGQFRPSLYSVGIESIRRVTSVVASHSAWLPVSVPVFQHDVGTVIGNPTSKRPHPPFVEKNTRCQKEGV